MVLKKIQYVYINLSTNIQSYLAQLQYYNIQILTAMRGMVKIIGPK